MMGEFKTYYQCFGEHDSSRKFPPTEEKVGIIQLNHSKN